MSLPHVWCTHVAGGAWHIHRRDGGAYRAACGRVAPFEVVVGAALPLGERCLGCVRAVFGADAAERTRALNATLRPGTPAQ